MDVAQHSIGLTQRAGDLNSTGIAPNGVYPETFGTEFDRRLIEPAIHTDHTQRGVADWKIDLKRTVDRLGPNIQHTHRVDPEQTTRRDSKAIVVATSDEQRRGLTDRVVDFGDESSTGRSVADRPDDGSGHEDQDGHRHGDLQPQ